MEKRAQHCQPVLGCFGFYFLAKNRLGVTSKVYHHQFLLMALCLSPFLVSLFKAALVALRVAGILSPGSLVIAWHGLSKNKVNPLVNHHKSWTLLNGNFRGFQGPAVKVNRPYHIGGFLILRHTQISGYQLHRILFWRCCAFSRG